MKKRVVSVLLCAALLLGCLSGVSFAADIVASGECGDQGDNVTWTLDSEGTLTISGTGAMADYQYISSNEISSDGNPWYANRGSVKTVVIKTGVTSIGAYAFSECRLTSVTIPDSVTSIGGSAFSNCSSLTSITIPDSVISIGGSAFSNCSSLTSITIPDSVTVIREWAFSDCHNLINITIPDSITDIEDGTFKGCSSLTSITIPDSVTSIGEEAFSDCSSLTSITIPDSVTSIGYSAFEGCSSLTSVTIPDSITSISWGTFYGCSSLTSVTIPNSVTSIGNSAFSACNSLSEIIVNQANPSYSSKDGILFNKSGTELICCPAGKTGAFIIPDSVTSIGNYTFEECSSLTSITIPDSVTSIGQGAFFDCSSLTSVTIPDSITSISRGTFYGCSSLTSVTIPNSVTSIGNGAFEGCSSLTSITIPDSVTSIDNYAFSGCSSLTSVTIPDSVKSIHYGAFSGCSSLTDVTIPNSITNIGESVFSGCSSLTGITILGNVDTISNNAFYGCTALQSIDLPGVQTIGSAAFRKCSGLTEVRLPETLTSVGRYAFHECANLTDVYYGGTEEDWAKVSIGTNNAPLLNATIHFKPHEHVWDAGTITTVPTCTEPGVRTFTCECGETKTEPEPALGHDLIHHDAQPASCTDPGWDAYDTCSRCEYSTYQEIPAPGHDFVNGICSRCGESDGLVRATLQAAKVTGRVGQTVQMTLTVPDNPGLASFKLLLSYDPAVLTPAGVKLEGAWADGISVVNGDSNPLMVGAVLFDGQTDSPLLATVSFTIAADAPEGETAVTITYDPEDVYNAAEENIALTVENGSVTVSRHVPGDVNGDGKVNNKDLTRLAQHLAGKDVECDMTALDVNGDGKINNKDLTRLAQYLAGKDVELH